jgi:hypothetical protein
MHDETDWQGHAATFAQMHDERKAFQTYGPVWKPIAPRFRSIGIGSHRTTLRNTYAYVRASYTRGPST